MSMCARSALAFAVAPRALASALALVVSLASADCGLPLRDAGAGASPARLCRAFSDFERALLFHARVFTILEALERIDAEQPKAEAQHGGREAAEGEP